MLGPYLLGLRGPGAFVGSGGEGDPGFPEPPIVTDINGDVTINGKVKPGSFGKFVYPLATVTAGRQYTFRAVANFSQLAKQGKLAMVGFGLKNGNDFHIAGLRGDGSTGTNEYIVHGTSPNGWNKQTGHTEINNGAAGAGTQHSAYYRLITSSDGATYTLKTSTDGVAYTTIESGRAPTPFTNVSSVTTFGVALWFNNTDAGPFSITITEFADATGVAGFIGAQVFTTAPGTADFTTRTAIQWDSEHFDTNGFHSGGANTRLTIPAELNGYLVVVLASVNLTGVNSGMDLSIAKGGSITFDGTSAWKNDPGSGSPDGVAGQMFLQCRTPPIQVATGDYFEAMLGSESDTNVTVVEGTSSFAIYVVGPSVMGCLLKQTGDLTTQNYSAGGVISWPGEVYDTDAFHDPGSNPSRITIPAGANGRYGILKFNLRLSSVTNNTPCLVLIAKSGSFLTAWMGWGWQQSRSGASTVSWCEAETQPVLLTTGDYFEAVISCSDTSVTFDANASTFSLEVLPASFSGALCKLNADLTAQNFSTPTDLAWNGADVYDTTGADQHDPASNNTKIIVTSGLNSKYAILHTNIQTSAIASGSSHSVVIQKGNTNVYPGFGGRGGNVSTGAALSGRTQIVQLATADEFTCQVYTNDTSSNLEVESTSFGLRVLPEQ